MGEDLEWKKIIFIEAICDLNNGLNKLRTCSNGYLDIRCSLFDAIAKQAESLRNKIEEQNQ